MTRRYTGGFLSGTEQVTDANSANGLFSVQEAGALTAAGNFPGGRWTPQNSLRFRNNGYLTRTLTASGSNTTFTWSGWIKRGQITTTDRDQWLFHGSNYATQQNDLQFEILFRTGADSSADCFSCNLEWPVSGTNTIMRTTAKYRDPSAWYHLIVAVDTTQAISSNRVRMYVNGVEQTSFTPSVTYPTQNQAIAINQANQTQTIGAMFLVGAADRKFDGYMAELNFVDGQQLTPSSFGFTDAMTGAWVPKRYTGTYGTNGFYLPLNSTFNSTFAADFLLVGGGGSGHADAHGGGGAGGYVEGTAQVAVATPYKITVGAGTASGSTTNGNPTFWGTLVGLYGGCVTNNGGSGGGGGNTDGTGNAGSSSQPANKFGTGYGYGGGNATSGGGYHGGGGGGAGSAGSNATGNSTGGNGGSGRASSLTGSSVTYAGGGGGGGYYGGSSGGSSIGGNGGNNVGTAATNGATNTGSGGGSAGSGRGLGGSGIAVIKIPNTYTGTFSAGVTYTTINSVSGYNIYRITATSTTSETVTFN
jgi:hypothetical protein